MNHVPQAIAKAIQRFENAVGNAWEHEGRDCSVTLARKLHAAVDERRKALEDAILESIGNFTPEKDVVIEATTRKEGATS